MSFPLLLYIPTVQKRNERHALRFLATSTVLVSQQPVAAHARIAATTARRPTLDPMRLRVRCVPNMYWAPECRHGGKGWRRARHSPSIPHHGQRRRGGATAVSHLREDAIFLVPFQKWNPPWNLLKRGASSFGVHYDRTKLPSSSLNAPPPLQAIAYAANREGAFLSPGHRYCDSPPDCEGA